MRSKASERRREAALKRLEAMSDPLGADVLQATFPQGQLPAEGASGQAGLRRAGRSPTQRGLILPHI